MYCYDSWSYREPWPAKKIIVDSYIIILTFVGLAALGMAWMPSISRETGISYAVIYVFLGIVLYIALGRLLPLPDPISQNKDTLHLTEMVVIVSLMGTGLKIDQPFSWKRWAIPLRLVSVTMILSIVIVTGAALWGFGFNLATALLLGAVLAPTDPVLASDVQVGPPMEEIQDKVKFSLTAEAGMNDGTAFPFTWLAIMLALNDGKPVDMSYWALFYLLYKVVVGVACGFAIGRLLAFLVFRLPEKRPYMHVRDGFVAISATLLVYGLTEMVQGYGFIAVFVTAITLRNYELHHRYHRKLHSFTDQIERILIAVVLILFGGSLVSGVLSKLTWPMALFSLAFVVAIRPLTTLVSLIRTRLHIKEKLAISFFGIKGMGSFYYLAFALEQRFFPKNEELWSILSFTVLLSILVHGLTATPVMKRLETEFAEKVTVNAT